MMMQCVGGVQYHRLSTTAFIWGLHFQFLMHLIHLWADKNTFPTITYDFIKWTEGSSHALEDFFILVKCLVAFCQQRAADSHVGTHYHSSLSFILNDQPNIGSVHSGLLVAKHMFSKLYLELACAKLIPCLLNAPENVPLLSFSGPPCAHLTATLKS